MRFAPDTLLLLFVALTAGACSMAQLDRGGAKIVVIDKPYETCEYVATAYGRSFFEENAMNNLRNKVAEAGATHLVLTAETQVTGLILPVAGDSLTVRGIGYRCPEKRAQAEGRQK
jgi:hypothetical protein